MFVQFIICLLSIFPVESAHSPVIHYEVSIPQPHTHLFQCEMTIDGLDREYLDLSMPVWTPGSYLIREFPRHVVEFEAVGQSNKNIKWHKTDKNTWRLETSGVETLNVKYVVYGQENGIRFSYVNSGHGHILGTNLFFFIDGEEDLPASLKLNLPEGWKVSNGVFPDESDPFLFKFRDYHELVDTPMLIGTHKEFKFTVDDVPHVVAIEGKTDADLKAYVAGTKKIVEAAEELMGGLPYEKYCFIMRFGSGGGGLEHANGTTMGTRRWGFTSPESNGRLFGLTAHEYFHAWNVKRLQSPAFKPYDYNSENYTDALWFYEGVTSYYTFQLLLRAELSKPKDILKRITQQIDEYRSHPGRLYQSATESSFDTWIKQYRGDENNPNSRMSYYTKGLIIGMLLDLEIMKRTDGEKSLDDVLMSMWVDFKTTDRGFESDDIKKYCEKICSSSFDQLFQDYVFGTKEVPFEDYFLIAGYELSKNEEEMKKEQKGAYLGAMYKESSGAVLITVVIRDTPAWDDGLNFDDEIIAADDIRIKNARDLDRILSRKKAEEEISFLVSRSDLIQNLKIKLGEHPNAIYKLADVEKPTELQLKIRKKWLKIKETN